MPQTVPNLTLREEKAAPLTAKEGDGNWKKLRNAVNAVFALFGISLNADGTLKDGAVATTAKLADRIVTAPKLFWTANLFAVAGGTDTYVATISPTTGFAYGDGTTTQCIVAIEFTNANTVTNPTININGGGARTMTKQGAVALRPGDIKAGSTHLLAIDAGGAQILNTLPESNAPLYTGLDSDAGPGDGTALTGSLAKIGTLQIEKPDGTAWKWVKVTWSTYIGQNMGVSGEVQVRVGSDTLPLLSNLSEVENYASNNSDDSFQFINIQEGVPTGHTGDNTLTLDVWAKFSATPGDIPAKRRFVAVGWYS